MILSRFHGQRGCIYLFLVTKHTLVKFGKNGRISQKKYLIDRNMKNYHHNTTVTVPECV